MAAMGMRRPTRKGSPNRAVEFKREIAAAACAPGISVAKLALEHGLNANLLFKWRRQYRAGCFGAPDPGHVPATSQPELAPASAVNAVRLLPVQASAIMEPTPTRSRRLHTSRSHSEVPRCGSAVRPRSHHCAQCSIRWRGVRDRIAARHPGVDRRGGDRYAQGDGRSRCAGANRSGRAPVFWRRVHFPRAPWRSAETAVVERRWHESLRQAFGTRALPVAAGDERHGASQRRATLDAARRHRLAAADQNVAAAVCGVSHAQRDHGFFPGATVIRVL